jgi:hypothetical protein
MKTRKIKPSEMGTTGLVDYVLGSYSIRSWVRRRIVAEKIMESRYGKEAVQRFLGALDATRIGRCRRLNAQRI